MNPQGGHPSALKELILTEIKQIISGLDNSLRNM